MHRVDNARDSAYVGRLSKVRFDPIFIMGDHRSGTTLLYQLLASTGAFNVVTAYHVIRYSELLANRLSHAEASAKEELAREFQNLGLTDRGLDRVAVSPELPEEYGFVLGGARPRLAQRNRERFEELCRKIQWLGMPDRPLLLKSPWDYANFVFVLKAFPTARFLFLHRDPVRVVNSQLRALRQSFDRHNPYVGALAPWYDDLWHRPRRLAIARALYSDRRPWGLRITCRHVRKSGLYYLNHVEALPPGQHLSLRYEDLCEDPAAALGRILGFVGKADHSGQMEDTWIRPRSDALLPEVEEHRDWIRFQTRVYCRWMGYEAEHAPQRRASQGE